MNWYKTDLADVIAILQSGSRPKGGVSTDSGEVMSLGGENIVQQGGVELRDVKRVPQSFYDAMTKGHLQDRDVLINKDGANTGKVGLFRDPGDGPACINEHLFLLRGDASKITQEYLYYTLLSERGQTIIRNRISGSAQPGLKSGFINNFPIDLPESTDEQGEIGKILGTLDRAIEQTEALIAKQQRIKTGLMQDLLTKGIDEHGNIRNEATHAFKDSPLGRIPVEWEVQKFDEITPKDAPIGYGIVQPGAYDDQGVPVAGIYTINSDFVLWHMSSKKIEQAYARSRICGGDVLLSIKGTTGRVGVVPEGTTANISRDVARIRPLERINAHYLRYLMLSELFQRYMENAQVGTTRAEISIKILRQLNVFVPPRPEQNEIARRIAGSEEHLFAMQKEMAKFQRTKAGLMHDLLTGARRVTPLLAPAATP